MAICVNYGQKELKGNTVFKTNTVTYVLCFVKIYNYNMSIKVIRERLFVKICHSFLMRLILCELLKTMQQI